MSSKKKNQHFVPKFYLRNFSYFKNDKQIGIYNTRKQFYFKTAPLKSQASKDFFYGADGIIEDGLSEIEGHLSVVIKGILESDSPALSQEDQHVLLLFIVLTDLRNPHQINWLQAVTVKMREKILETAPNTPNIDELLPIPSHEECVRLSLRNCLEIVESIQDLKFKILVNLTEIPFITSDCPVVKYNQFLEWRRWKHPKTGYGSIGLQIFVPLNYKKMIVLYDSNSYEFGNPDYITYRLKESNDIDQLNLLQLVNCIETLYFDEKTEENYIKEMHDWANDFNKANVPYSELSYLIEDGKKPDKKNLVVNGTSECEIHLRIKGLKLKSKIKGKNLNNSVVHSRPGSLTYEQIKKHTGN